MTQGMARWKRGKCHRNAFWLPACVLTACLFGWTLNAPGATDLIATEVYFRDQPQNSGNLVPNPKPGQQVYPHFRYIVDSTGPVAGALWQLELDGAVLCAFNGTEPTGSRIGWCTSPWSATMGAHILRGVLDLNGAIAESNENNNVATFSFTLATGADIRISPLTLNFDSANNRTIYLEIDWMENADHSHRPSAAVLDAVVQTFAVDGFNLVLDLSNPIPHQDVIDVSGAPSDSSAVQSIRNQNFNHAADSRYFYGIWAHNYSQGGVTTTSSGIADLPGRIHVVTLGSFPNQVGTVNHQIGTFVHELGHNLGQRHGGIDDDNYKPNYLSVMNYLFQLNGIGLTLQSLGWANSSSGFNNFGYSHGLRPNLNENNLSEPAGIGLGTAVDWNCDGDATDQGVAHDLQASQWCQANGALSILTDFDNWSSLTNYVQPGTFRSQEVAPEQKPQPCITVEEYMSLQRAAGLPLAAGPANPTREEGPRPTVTSGGLGFTIFNDGNSNLVVTSITKDAAADWISWTQPTPFTIVPGGAQAIAVTVDFLRAPFGLSTRRLLVQSNDPDESPYPGAVNIVVNNQNCPAPRFDPLVRLPDGKVRLTLVGNAACAYRVDASTNLQNWAPLISFPAGTNINQVVDPNAAQISVRFYRAVAQ